MKKIYINLFLVFVLAVAFANTAYASLNITVSVDVPPSCNATDTDGVVHNYPQDNSYLAICALEAALQNGSVSGIQLSNQYPSLGLFVTAINGTVADPNSQYWALYQNNSYAALGLASLPIAQGDVIILQLHDFSDNNLGDQLTLNIRSLTNNATTSGGSGPQLNENDSSNPISQPVAKSVFDSQKAFEYLASQQKDSGLILQDMITDWSAISFASSPNYSDQKNKLKKYYLENNLTGSSLTDYERRTMALMSLGLDPYDTNGVNYIKNITDSFDGTQFGDKSHDNDDIFALIVLQNAGYKQGEAIIKNSVSFILSKQKEDGSWDESVDMTGAAMEALASFKNLGEAQSALNKAEDFLRQSQKDSGGWANVSSTSWAMEGILAMGEKPVDWVKSGNNPLDYLADNQEADGGIKDDNAMNKIWETEYALAAFSGTTWNQTMREFAKETPVVPAFSVIIAKVETKTDIAKTEIGKEIKKIAQTFGAKNNSLKFNKLAILAAQNTASAINAVQNNQKPAQKRGWLMNFLGKIFGF